jgi:glutathione synthase/RimK-type ligase-like ATP-grasp enzyme
MRIAIHHREGSFSNEWIKLCEEKNIKYSVVNAFDNNIDCKILDSNLFLWHFRHDNSVEKEFATKFITTLGKLGVETFPSCFDTNYYDNKVAQKYIMEFFDIKHAKYHYFIDKRKASLFLENTEYPIVTKRSTGSGSINVSLLKSKRKANKLLNKAFGKGLKTNKTTDRLKILKNSERRDEWQKSLKILVKHFFYRSKLNMFREKGFILFQEFVPKQTYDIRIVVVSNRAYCAKRLCPKGDFRASGIGRALYGKNEIDIRFIQLAFESAKKMNVSLLAIDMVFDKRIESPVIVEISPLFSPSSMNPCEGYYTNELIWINDKTSPQYALLDLLISKNK